MDLEYTYDDQLPTDRNIALALFAIANELNNLIENKSQQSLDLKNTLKKELSEIAGKIAYLYETMKTIHSADETEKAMTMQIIEQLSNISDRLDSISKNLRSHSFS